MNERYDEARRRRKLGPDATFCGFVPFIVITLQASSRAVEASGPSVLKSRRPPCEPQSAPMRGSCLVRERDGTLEIIGQAQHLAG